MGGRGSKSSASGLLGSPTTQRDDYTQEQIDALYNYTRSSSINGSIARDGIENLSEEEKAMIKNMDEAIAKSGWNVDQNDTGLVRGGGAIMVGVPVDMSFDDPQDLANYINDNLIGKPHLNVGYTSMTKTPSIAGLFAEGEHNPIVMEYKKIKAGVKGAYVSGGDVAKPISYYKTGEDETIGQRNIKTYPMHAYVGDDGIVHVDVMATT